MSTWRYFAASSFVLAVLWTILSALFSQLPFTDVTKHPEGYYPYDSHHLLLYPPFCPFFRPFPPFVLARTRVGVAAPATLFSFIPIGGHPLYLS